MLKHSVLSLMAGVLLFASYAKAEDAESKDVTFYGVGHLSVDHSDDNPQDDDSIASNSSRLGIKAEHMFNEYVTLFGQFEMGVDLTLDGNNDGNGGNDNNSFFTNARDSFVGVRGNWGGVKAGRQGILNQWLYDYNLFADQVGDLGNIWGGSGVPGRADNTFSYETPAWQGLSGIVLYTPESNAGPDDKVFLGKINYTDGMFAVGLGHATIDQGSISSNEYGVTAITASVKAGQLDFAGQDISGSTVGLGYQMESDIGGAGANDRDSYTIGAALKINGPHTVKTQFTWSDADLAGQDANQIAVGYDYALNEQLTLYLAYAQASNATLATFSANNYGHGKSITPIAGNDPQVISVGLVYAFDYGIDTGFFAAP